MHTIRYKNKYKQIMNWSNKPYNISINESPQMLNPSFINLQMDYKLHSLMLNFVNYYSILTKWLQHWWKVQHFSVWKKKWNRIMKLLSFWRQCIFIYKLWNGNIKPPFPVLNEYCTCSTFYKKKWSIHTFSFLYFNTLE